MDIDSHAGELASDLGVEKQEVAADLETLLEYDVPLNEAKQSLRRKYGEGGSGGTAPTAASVGDVTTTDSSVTVTGRVLTVGMRTIVYNGEKRTISEGEIADETGVISYTAWDAFGFEAGDTITVGNAGVREWDGEPQLNLNENTSVTTETEPLSVPYEIGGERSLIDLAAGDRGVTLEVAVIECEQRTIDGRDGPTDILSGVLGDETTRLPFTDWDLHTETIEAGASVRLEDCYVREHRGVPSVNVSEFTTVTPLDRSVEATETAPTMEIGAAVAGGSTFDVELTGAVLDVRDGSGLIQRCPECNRVIQNGQCRSHGAVSGVDDLRVKAILDDGTGTATAVLDRELTERVYGGTLEDALDHARDAMDKEVVTAAIAAEIVGLEHRVRGSLSVDDYGATLDATEFEPITDDPADRARTLLAEVDG